MDPTVQALRDYQKLLVEGIIDEREFAAKKAELLSKVSSVAAQPTALAASATAPALAQQPKVAVFWDYENVRVPPTITTAGAVAAIRRLAREHGNVDDLRLYYDSRNQGENQTDRTKLQTNGFTLVDCPKRKDVKETLDKTLIVDMMSFRVKCENACVVIITGDGDYAYALNTLSRLGVKIIVIYGPFSTTAGDLLDAADVAISFDKLFSAGRGEEPENTSSASSLAYGPSEAKSEEVEVETVQADDDDPLYIHSVNWSGGGNDWTTDAKVCATYYKKTGRKDKDALRGECASAIDSGLVEVGQRRVSDGMIVPVDTTESAQDGFSPQVYIRLTDIGRERLSASWSPQDDPSYKTELCKYHMSLVNRCNRGSACPYAHGESELRPRKTPR
jgi:uncharacterized LabA/DUF88 family protein